MIETTDDPVNGISIVTRYQHPNHQDSTTLETDEYHNVITYEEYHPFGTTSYQATNGAVTAAAKRYRYTGMERDDETGLEYHNARYDIFWLGRWMNCDPIGIGDGVNVYAYCRNNPVLAIDKTGTQTDETGGKENIITSKIEDINTESSSLKDIKYTVSIPRLENASTLQSSAKFTLGSLKGDAKFGAIAFLSMEEYETGEQETQADVRGYLDVNFSNHKRYSLSGKIEGTLIGPFTEIANKGVDEVLKNTVGRADIAFKLRFMDKQIGYLRGTLIGSGESNILPFKQDSVTGYIGAPKFRIGKMEGLARITANNENSEFVSSYKIRALKAIKTTGTITATEGGVAASGGLKVNAPPFAIASGRYSYLSSGKGLDVKSLDYLGLQFSREGIGFGYSGVRSFAGGKLSFGAKIGRKEGNIIFRANINLSH
jgi:RHS repeat-associated protein